MRHNPGGRRSSTCPSNYSTRVDKVDPTLAGDAGHPRQRRIMWPRISDADPGVLDEYDGLQIARGCGGVTAESGRLSRRWKVISAC